MLDINDDAIKVHLVSQILLVCCVENQKQGYAEFKTLRTKNKGMKNLKH